MKKMLYFVGLLASWRVFHKMYDTHEWLAASMCFVMAVVFAVLLDTTIRRDAIAEYIKEGA